MTLFVTKLGLEISDPQNIYKKHINPCSCWLGEKANLPVLNVYANYKIKCVMLRHMLSSHNGMQASRCAK